MSDTPTRVVPVEVFGQQFPIRSDLDETYIQALADFVNERIRAAAVVTPSSDSLRVAVLAALNIADEYFRARDAARSFPRAVADRTERLVRLIDGALEPARPAEATEPPPGAPAPRLSDGGE